MVINASVLALQGDFKSHAEKLRSCFPDIIIEFVKKKDKLLTDTDLIIIPGGESSVIGELAEVSGLKDKIIDCYESGSVIFTTCAGSILIAKEIINPGKTISWNLLNIKIERNAYGRQINSSIRELNITDQGKYYTDKKIIEGFFIRAPKIIETAENVEVLALDGSDPVLVKQDNIIACTFHPELSDDIFTYQVIEKMIEEKNLK